MKVLFAFVVVCMFVQMLSCLPIEEGDKDTKEEEYREVDKSAYKGGRCDENMWWKDDCNTCSCGKGYYAACTLIGCFSETVLIKQEEPAPESKTE